MRHVRYGMDRLASLVIQPFDTTHADRLVQSPTLAHSLGIDEQNLGNTLDRLAVVQQQQRVHATVHRARPPLMHCSETHRDRMTTGLFFMLHLLDCFPDLRLTADLSHYVVGREFAWPIGPENHAMMHRLLDNSWGLHGRVASREQIQVQLGFPQHRDWVELFMGWWEYGIRSWRRRAPADATLTFLCELGPPTYAITGADGYELSDRWQEALQMRDMIRALWQRIEREDA